MGCKLSPAQSLYFLFLLSTLNPKLGQSAARYQDPDKEMSSRRIGCIPKLMLLVSEWITPYQVQLLYLFFSWRGYFIPEGCAANILRFSQEHLLKGDANRSNFLSAEEKALRSSTKTEGIYWFRQEVTGKNQSQSKIKTIMAYLMRLPARVPFSFCPQPAWEEEIGLLDSEQWLEFIIQTHLL